MKRRMFDKGFFREMLPIAIPVALQNLLLSSFRLVDTLMIGKLGDTALSATGLAGSVSFLVELIAFGMASGSAVFIAQYHGAGNKVGIRRAFGASFVCLVPAGILFTLVAMCFPLPIMRLLTNSEALIAEGAKYLVWAAPSYIGLMFAQEFSTVLRSTERVRLPMLASGISALCNAFLNYIFIFGKLGFPAMGVAGAGLATSISAFLTPLIIYLVSLKQRNILIAPLRELFDLKGFFFPFMRRVLPALGNEMLWSLSVVLCNMILGRMGDEYYAGLTAFRTIENIGFVFFVGVCNACNILVGKHIGAGDVEGGKRLSRQFFRLVPFLGAFVGGMVILLRAPILTLFDISALARETAMGLMLLYGIEVSVRNIPYIAVVGVFRGGGDTRIGLIGDVSAQYLCILPALYLCGLVFKLPFLTSYLIMLLVDDVVKLAIYVPYYLSNRWIKPVTAPPVGRLPMDAPQLTDE